MTPRWTVRNAEPAELDALARLWHQTWHEGHPRIVPIELAQRRTLESFRQRLEHALPDVRVVGPLGDPLGFCIVRGSELYQLFVSSSAHGSGVAAALLEDGERRLRGNGIRTAWLACAIGNDRAATFYEKHAWRRAGTMTHHAETPDGPYPLEVWRYEKSLLQ